MLLLSMRDIYENRVLKGIVKDSDLFKLKGYL